MSNWPTRTAPSPALWGAIFLLGAVTQITRAYVDFREADGISIPFAKTWIGRDFTNFWIGPQLATEGVNVYHNSTYMAYLREWGIEQGQHYLYPPATLIFELPFSLLPYPVALGFWVLGGLIAFWLAARPYIRFHPLWLLLLPGLLTRNGQWGAFAGALFLWSFRGSGLAAGLLTMKPHLGILLGVSMLMKRCWRQILVAVLVCLVVWGIAELIFNLTYEFFTDGFRVQRFILNDPRDQPYFGGMPSTYIRLRGLEYAWLAHLLVATVALALFWRARACRLKDLAFPAATATFLVLPYGLLYDMAVVSLGFAVLMYERWGSMKIWQRTVVTVAFLSPALTHYTIVPIILLAGLFVQVQQLLATPADALSGLPSRTKPPLSQKFSSIGP